MSDLGIGSFLTQEILLPVYDQIYAIIFEAIDATTNNMLSKSAPKLHPSQTRKGDGSRLFLSYITIILLSVVGIGLTIRMWGIFESIRTIT